ncbi:MAG TPA: hypothetical protein VIA62_02020 [Thermoanaerobaculia bacterium]|jgi:hypothetical protein|nr:hypothetical protein [Thermoanaerobaculia bacterium]
MPIFNPRRGLTALTLATLLSASPVLAQGQPQSRTARVARTGHPAGATPQFSLLDLLHDTLSRLVASATSTPPTSKQPGDAGVRIDPEGVTTAPAPGPAIGPP